MDRQTHDGKISFSDDGGVLLEHSQRLHGAKEMPVVEYVIAQTAGSACTKRVVGRRDQCRQQKQCSKADVRRN